MNIQLDRLQRRMEAAAAAQDFEEAGRLRDQISLLRGAGDAGAPVDLDTSRLQRQVPGKMGLGTSDQAMKPPEGWVPPKKPDLMTTGKPRRRR